MMPKPQYDTSREQALDILALGEYGVLSLAFADGQPYGVPLNYCFDREKNCVYVHCAKNGKKLKALAQNDKISFLAVTRCTLVPERLDTDYESVIVTGRAAVVQDEAEVLHALVLLCRRLSPDMADKVAGMNCMARVAILRISVDEAAGKRKNLL